MPLIFCKISLVVEVINMKRKIYKIIFELFFNWVKFLAESFKKWRKKAFLAQKTMNIDLWNSEDVFIFFLTSKGIFGSR